MPTKKLILSSLLPLVLLAGACSDNDGDGDSASENGSPTTSSSAEDPTTDDRSGVDSADADGADADGADADGSGDDADGTASVTNEGDALGTPPGDDTASLNISQIAAGTAELSTLTRAVIKGGLLATVRDGGPFTVFAPTNEAFAAVPAGTLNGILADQAELTALLTLHVLNGEYTGEDLVSLDGSTVETVEGARLAVSVDGDTIKVGDATVTAPDIAASNGVVHVVDAVITAPSS